MCLQHRAHGTLLSPELTATGLAAVLPVGSAVEALAGASPARPPRLSTVRVQSNRIGTMAASTAGRIETTAVSDIHLSHESSIDAIDSNMSKGHIAVNETIAQKDARPTRTASASRGRIDPTGIPPCQGNHRRRSATLPAPRSLN